MRSLSLFSENTLLGRCNATADERYAPSAAVEAPEESTPSAGYAENRRRALRFGSALVRIDPALVLLLAVPVVIFALDSTWLFAYSASRLGFIDPWVYFGFFLDLVPHLRAFPGGYYGGRLPWILPGALAYHVFRPIVAAYVLHVVFCDVALASLYLLLKNTVNRRAAFLCSILMGCYTYWLWAMGWDYVDGAAITYFLLTLCLLTYAAKAANPYRWMLASGVAFGAALYTQLFLLTFAPLLWLYYVFARREYAAPAVPYTKRPFARGFGAITLALAAVNTLINHRPLFFWSSVSTASKLVTRGNPWRFSSYAWLGSAAWLLVPVFLLLAALLWLAFGRRMEPAYRRGFLWFWPMFLVLTVALMLAWQLIGQPVLQLAYYASLMIPAIFLALGALFGQAVARLRGWQFGLLCIVVVAVLLASFVVPLEQPTVAYIRTNGGAVLAALVLALVLGSLRITRALAIVALCAAVAMINVTVGTRTWGHGGQPDDPALEKDAFLLVVDADREIHRIDPTAHVFFWYNSQEKLGPMYRSVASTHLWARRLVSESFPAMGPKMPPVNTKIAILSTNSHAVEQANASLREVGLAARLLETRTLHEGTLAWEMTVIVLERTPAASLSQPAPH